MSIRSAATQRGPAARQRSAQIAKEPNGWSLRGLERVVMSIDSSTHTIYKTKHNRGVAAVEILRADLPQRTPPHHHHQRINPAARTTSHVNSRKGVSVQRPCAIYCTLSRTCALHRAVATFQQKLNTKNNNIVCAGETRTTATPPPPSNVLVILMPSPPTPF